MFRSLRAPASISAISKNRFRLTLTPLDDRLVPSTAYLATDLASDQPGVAPVIDPTLVNAWGIAMNPSGPAWVSANGTGLSEVYGNPAGALSQPFKVTTPGGATTGQVFNGTPDFVVSSGTASGPAAFIFASESGAVTGWNPGVPPPPPAKVSEFGFQATDGAVYKGIALAQSGGKNYLYLTDFHNGKIDVLDGQFHLTHLAGSFTDPNLPAGYAPFNVAAINGQLYVTFAKQGAEKMDEVDGKGLGFVDVFTTDGTFVKRLVSKGDLNAPWGMALAPATFGEFGGALLVGNFGDGKIHAYDPNTGKSLGTVESAPGHPVTIDGLWGLAFGFGANANTLFYAAGPGGEAHGLFGDITAHAAGTNPVSATLAGDVLTITGSRDDDRVSVDLTHGGTQIVVRAGGDVIGEFDAAAVGSIHFNGLAGDDDFRVDSRIDLPVVADGGAGNDTIQGGGGTDLLLGGPGDDELIGQGGRDVLIGGDGADRLHGNGGDDLLIGGSTTLDASALNQVLGEWTSSDSYLTRVAKLRAGTGGLPKLDSTTVTDDGAKDELFGGSGLDWFFVGSNGRVHGKSPAEVEN
jgi:uncharacterized protein (TIGR03118 family)